MTTIFHFGRWKQKIFIINLGQFSTRVKTTRDVLILPRGGWNEDQFVPDSRHRHNDLSGNFWLHGRAGQSNITTLPPTSLPTAGETEPVTANTVMVAPSVAPVNTAVVSPTATPLPEITLIEGDFYFSIDGKPSFLFSRNLAGNEISQYSQLLDLTNTGGSKLVRIQLDSFGMGYSNTGKVDEAWAKKLGSHL